MHKKVTTTLLYYFLAKSKIGGKCRFFSTLHPLNDPYNLYEILCIYRVLQTSEFTFTADKLTKNIQCQKPQKITLPKKTTPKHLEDVPLVENKIFSTIRKSMQNMT